MERYAVTVDEARRIVELRIAGNMTSAEHAKAREALLAVCRAEGIRRILIDAADLGGEPTTQALFDFASGWIDVLRRNPVVVAGILPRNDSVRRWWRFGEDVAINRGLICHPFETRDEARAWLARW
jgi:hypothetical protein